jgi:hypothetical protein
VSKIIFGKPTSRLPSRTAGGGDLRNNSRLEVPACQAHALFAQLFDMDIDEARDVFRLFRQLAEEAGLLPPSR